MRQSLREAPEKFWGVVPLHFFGSTSTISHFYKRFLDGHYSLVSFLFAVLLLTVSLCSAICKNGARAPVSHGGHVPPCPMESVPLSTETITSLHMMGSAERHWHCQSATQ